MTAETPKKVDVRILSMHCPECGGTGFKFFFLGSRKCKRCTGTGDISVAVDLTPAFYMSPNDSFALCPGCVEEGRIHNKDCVDCGGSRRKLIFGDFGRHTVMPKAYDPWQFNPHVSKEEKMNKEELEKRLKDQLDNIEKLKKDADETLRKLKGGEVACSFYDPLWEPKCDDEYVVLPGNEAGPIPWSRVTDNNKAIGNFFKNTDAIARWKLDLVEWKKFMDMGDVGYFEKVLVPILNHKDGEFFIDSAVVAKRVHPLVPQFSTFDAFHCALTKVDEGAIVRVMRRRAKGWI